MTNEEKDTERFSDIELALYFAFHIDNPCFTKVNGKNRDIRDFHIREARRVLPNLNYHARSFLESVIRDYTPEQEFIASSQ